MVKTSSYHSWIQENYPDAKSAERQCAEATKQMVEAFPELQRVRGHASVSLRDRPHWWCITPTGEIIDPTAHQWETQPWQYTALVETGEEPHGKCLNCGGILFRSAGATSFHCKDCKDEAKF